ncbi:RHS repeat protein, partial [Corallococcus sicarius]
MDVMGAGDRLTSYARRLGGGGILTRSVMGGQTLRTELDALGRSVLQQWNRGGPQLEPVYVQTEYKTDGKVWRVSQPHTANETPLFTYFDEDALGRPKKLTRLDGSFRTWSYDLLTSEVTDEAGRRYRTTLDGRGKVVSESKLLQSGTTSVSYSYGVRGELREVRDENGNITSLEYDALGRQTALVDADQGRTGVGFNAFDEVIRRTDALGVTSIERDGLGRPQDVTSPDGVTRYAWDGAAGSHGSGKLESVVSPDGVRTEYLYDSIGRPAETTWVVQGQRFSLATTYDDYGRPLTLSYPLVGPTGSASRLVVQKTYDGVGNLASIKNAETGFSYWTALERNSLGQIPRELYGNGVGASRVFDKTGTLRYLEASGLGQVQQLAFKFSVDGNLEERHDLLNGTSEDFEYDDSDRLKAWKVTQHGAISRQEYTYDSIGNLKTHPIVAGPGFTSTFGYGGPRPHAVTSQTQKGLTRQMDYDAVGNQFANGKGQTIQYTSFDLPAQVSRGQETTHYKYDGAHRRVLKVLPNGDETLTLADVYERRVQAGLTNHVFSLKADGALIAQVHWREGSAGAVESEQVFYIHADPLGTPSAITDAQGQVVERMNFAPFGGRQALNDLAQEMDVPSFLRNGFQGHSIDDESQLVNMKGRMYDPALGAFLTPDPVVSSSLNRYRFGLNNPLKNTDPSGFDVVGWGLNIFRRIGGGG